MLASCTYVHVCGQKRAYSILKELCAIRDTNITSDVADTSDIITLIEDIILCLN